MGKEKDDLIDGLPYKKRSSFIEISGAIKAEHVKPLYRRVAFRLPVYLKCQSKKRKYIKDTIKVKIK